MLEQHLACAANELPLCLQYDEKYFRFGLEHSMSSLRNKGYLGNNPGGDLSKNMWSYIGPEVSFFPCIYLITVLTCFMFHEN